MRPDRQAVRRANEPRKGFSASLVHLLGFNPRHPATRLLLFTAGAVLLFSWPLWIANYRFPTGGGDLWGQLHPVWSYIASWLRRGVIPLWHTGIMAGDPIFAEGQYGLFNPLNWPMFLFSPVPSWAVSLRGMFSLWLAGAGMVLYLHYSPAWRIPAAAALVGGTAYMFADPFIAHLGHPQFNDAMAWLPWALWMVDGAIRRRRALPLGGLTLALLLLSGHGQASIYGALTVGIYALWQAFEAGLRRFPRRLGRLLLVAILAAALAMPAILPGLERLPYTERANLPPKPGEYEFHLEMWRDYISPAYHGRNIKTFWGPWERVETGSVGVVALGLAVLGLCYLTQRRTFFLWFLGILSVLFALGTQAPLYPMLAPLPFFDATWKTGRVIYLLSFVLAAAAAQGTAWLIAGRGNRIWTFLILAGALWISINAPNWAGFAPD
ncbi:MAG: YfhO family protein, partial [Anaerolineae bacterium]|nr:YfhO family protein [Anaerolineae bacterium]